jgi:hypothetical protein
VANEDAEHRARVRAALEYFDAECAAGKAFANPGGFIVSLVAKGVPKRPRAARAAGRTKSASPPEPAATDVDLELEMAYEVYRNDVGTKRFAGLGESERTALLEQITEVVTDEARLRPEGSEVERLLADNTRAREWTGWSPTVGLREGLQRTSDWIAANLDAVDTAGYAV